MTAENSKHIFYLKLFLKNELSNLCRKKTDFRKWLLIIPETFSFCLHGKFTALQINQRNLAFKNKRNHSDKFSTQIIRILYYVLCVVSFGSSRLKLIIAWHQDRTHNQAVEFSFFLWIFLSANFSFGKQMAEEVYCFQVSNLQYCADEHKRKSQ